MDSRFCQVHTPHPLGEDKDRFHYLINDIKNRKDDYAAQLSQLTLAALSQNSPKGEDAKHQIMSTILGRPSAANHDQQITDRDKIWHARLVLTIGEMLDKEQEDVAKALTFLDESESDLFEKLKGTDEEDDTESILKDLNALKSKLNKEPAKSIQNRFLAWFRFIQASQLPDCPIWTTTREEAADILFENHQRETGIVPLCIAELPLPMHIAANESRVPTIDDGFRLKSITVLKLVYEMIVKSTSDISQNDDFGALSEQWNTLINDHYPAKEFGRISVKLYHFENPLTDFTGLKTKVSVPGASILAVLNV